MSSWEERTSGEMPFDDGVASADEIVRDEDPKCGLHSEVRIATAGRDGNLLHITAARKP